MLFGAEVAVYSEINTIYIYIYIYIYIHTYTHTHTHTQYGQNVHLLNDKPVGA
jgi:hypothetical protein